MCFLVVMRWVLGYVLPCHCATQTQMEVDPVTVFKESTAAMLEEISREPHPYYGIRSAKIYVFNCTPFTLSRSSTPTFCGAWKDQFPKDIGPFSSGYATTMPWEFLKGTRAGVTFIASDSAGKGEVSLEWECPFFGPNYAVTINRGRFEVSIRVSEIAVPVLHVDPPVMIGLWSSADHCQYGLVHCGCIHNRAECG